MNLEKKSKPYPITREQVWEAYKLVKGKNWSRLQKQGSVTTRLVIAPIGMRTKP